MTIAWGGLALVVLRVWAILRMQVMWHRIAPITWPWLAPGIAVMLAPLVTARTAVPAVAIGSPDFVAAAVLELGLGTVIGAVASLPGHALLGGATMQAGLLSSSSRPFVALVSAIAAAAAFGVGVHHAAIEALAQGVSRWPLGSAPPRGALGLATLLEALDALLVLALAFATPVALVIAVVDVVTASVGRTPSSAMLARIVGSLGRTALALVALGASWDADPAAWARACLP